LSKFKIRREHLAFALIAAFGLGGAIAIHANASYGITAAKERFRTESHAAAMAALYIAQGQFTAIYQNLRTISRLPSVKQTDRHATNINQDGLRTIQEIYNNLASNVAVSEVYVVPRTLNSERIDPVTGAPEAPIISYDDLITGSGSASGDASANVVKQFEPEIYEYHQLHRQMLWFAAHTPDIKSTSGFDIPMLSAPQIISCDNTVFNLTHDNADRTSLVFSVPFFGPDGNFVGTISAFVRIKAVRAMLPAKNFALVNQGYHAVALSKGGVEIPDALDFIKHARPDPSLIYSETLTLDAHDPQFAWTLWAGLPDAAFWARPDVRAVQSFATGAYSVLTLLLLMSGAAVWFVTRNARRIAGAAAALDALAHGDEDAKLEGAERPGPAGELARAFVKFRDALIQKRIIEEGAADSAKRAEAERQRFDAERSEAMAAQKEVVDTLAGALISFANGDLTFKINQFFENEFKSLRMDFNQASAKMEATMRRVATSTHNVESGAREVQQAAEDFARRTEQQAAGLEQTAAALEEITGTVRKTSQIASGVADLAAAARTDADKSASVVRDTVSAMTGIENSSRQIANIISVIDEIAFQTNLLALNAGVEAARAGDAGRGFAVVATEVRALARRSADAAKEIKAIIAASGREVGNGVKLVNETGEALTRITTQINQLAGRVAEIAAAAREQAQGLNQINSAVNHMDQATQQNAAMVEQVAAAGGSLTEEAQALSQLLSEFKISEAKLEAPPPRGDFAPADEFEPAEAAD
jgi:methyl-accepting chemotaxis protein